MLFHPEDKLLFFLTFQHRRPQNSQLQNRFKLMKTAPDAQPETPRSNPFVNFFRHYLFDDEKDDSQTTVNYTRILLIILFIKNYFFSTQRRRRKIRKRNRRYFSEFDDFDF